LCAKEKYDRRGKKKILQHRQPLGDWRGPKNRGHQVDLRVVLRPQKVRTPQPCQEQEIGCGRACKEIAGIADVPIRVMETGLGPDCFARATSFVE
jgi:hypothetical protein